MTGNRCRCCELSHGRKKKGNYISIDGRVRKFEVATEWSHVGTAFTHEMATLDNLGEPVSSPCAYQTSSGRVALGEAATNKLAPHVPNGLAGVNCLPPHSFAHPKDLSESHDCIGNTSESASDAMADTTHLDARVINFFF